jgi:hypothetical protein
MKTMAITYISFFNGYVIISSEGISVDPTKVQEVMDWKPQLQSIKFEVSLDWQVIIVDSSQISPR